MGNLHYFYDLVKNLLTESALRINLICLDSRRAKMIQNDDLVP